MQTFYPSQNTKLLQHNTGEKLENLGFGNNFSKTTSKTKSTKEGSGGPGTGRLMPGSHTPAIMSTQ